MSGWSGSTRRARLPPNWPELRAIVLQRCGNRCEFWEQGHRCTERATDVDHVTRGDDHTLANLQGLCEPHHKAKTAREAMAARGHGPGRLRPTEPHPGLNRHA